MFVSAIEGPSMLVMGILGIILNLTCLAVLSHNKQLKLSHDYLCILRAQSIFDLLYIITSTPVTVLPSQTFQHFQEPLYILPWIFPFMQIAMTASIYNTIALAIERYLSIRDISVTKTFPYKIVVTVIMMFSIVINIPRFFELRVFIVQEENLKKVNNTGDLLHDFVISTSVYNQVRPAAQFYTLGYFLGYNIIGSFLISLFIPVVMLSVFNMLIWFRLKNIWKNQLSLGVKEKRSAKAAITLVLVVIMFIICHSMKLVISIYQMADVLISPTVRLRWPSWVDVCIFLSHFLLCLSASVNIIIFCICDSYFISVLKKMIKHWLNKLSLLGSCNVTNQSEESPAFELDGMELNREIGHEEAAHFPAPVNEEESNAVHFPSFNSANLDRKRGETCVKTTWRRHTN